MKKFPSPSLLLLSSSMEMQRRNGSSNNELYRVSLLVLCFFFFFGSERIAVLSFSVEVESRFSSWSETELDIWYCFNGSISPWGGGREQTRSSRGNWGTTTSGFLKTKRIRKVLPATGVAINVRASVHYTKSSNKLIIWYWSKSKDEKTQTFDISEGLPWDFRGLRWF